MFVVKRDIRKFVRKAWRRNITAEKQRANRVYRRSIRQRLRTVVDYYELDLTPRATYSSYDIY